MPSTDFRLDLAVFSDCHLPIQNGHPDVDRFFQVLRGASDVSNHVVLLGDVFQVWAGIPPFDHGNGHRLLDLLEELGTDRFSLVEGNWDFYIQRVFGDRFARVTPVGFQMELGGRIIRFAHGHLHTGWKDRLWMGCLKSAMAYHLFKTGWFNGFLSSLNRRFQAGMYSEVLTQGRLENMCQRLEQQYGDADRIICGHAHRLFQHGRVTVLPDYHSTGLFWGFDGEDHYFQLLQDGIAPVGQEVLSDEPELLEL